MIRRVFFIVSVMSLLLCVGTCALWVRSYFVGDEFNRIGWQDHGARIWYQLSLWSGSGLLEGHSLNGDADFHIPYDPPYKRESVWPRFYHYTFSDQSSFRRRKPFFWWSYPRTHGAIRYVGFPHWLPASAFAVLPGVQVVLIIRRKRRVRIGHCPACGYDLRDAKPVSGVRAGS